MWIKNALVVARDVLVTAAAAILVWPLAGVHAADAASYPERPVRLIVPFPPGGGTDIVGRLLAQKLGDSLGQTFVVDNRPGAASTLGAAIAAKASPDGYTLLLITASYAMSASYYTNLQYDPVRDFSAVSLVASGPLLIVVHPSVAASSIRELIALAKASPGKLNYASGGAGGINHLAGELFNSMSGIKLVHVPYKGAGPALTAVMSGETQVMIATLSSSLPHVRSGKLKALALAGDRRFRAAGDLPTISESGLPGYSADNWYGLVAPRHTPASTIALLNKHISAVLATDDFRSQLVNLGFEPMGSTPKAMDAHLKQEVAKWGKVIRASGSRLE
ncbi:MAG: tripartite tricarboxylate transporter substrate binding protein [Betaproteobacteria bacterium]|nr:tripartite tricarboxylate transporter substrate binding protein [Betaproteobacteria bacterium]